MVTNSDARSSRWLALILVTPHSVSGSEDVPLPPEFEDDASSLSFQTASAFSLPSSSAIVYSAWTEDDHGCSTLRL